MYPHDVKDGCVPLIILPPEQQEDYLSRYLLRGKQLDLDLLHAAGSAGDIRPWNTAPIRELLRDTRMVRRHADPCAPLPRLQQNDRGNLAYHQIRTHGDYLAEALLTEYRHAHHLNREEDALDDEEEEAELPDPEQIIHENENYIDVSTLEKIPIDIKKCRDACKYRFT